MAIVGDGPGGLEAARVAALQGHQVTEFLDDIAVKSQSDNKKALRKKLDEYNVNIITGHKVCEFTADGVVIEGKDGNKEKLAADTMIAAFGKNPVCMKLMLYLRHIQEQML